MPAVAGSIPAEPTNKEKSVMKVVELAEELVKGGDLSAEVCIESNDKSWVILSAYWSNRGDKLQIDIGEKQD